MKQITRKNGAPRRVPAGLEGSWVGVSAAHTLIMAWAAIALVCFLAAPAVYAQTTLYTFDGDSAFDRFGDSVSGAGDVNADGFADVIIGTRLDDNNGQSSGSARVFSGFDGSVLYTLNGDAAGDQFGNSVSGAGDVDGDGFADLIVGAPGDDNSALNSGSARVFSGVDGSILYTFDGDSPGDVFGISVSGAGDVNADGVPDLIVGAPHNESTKSGSARVFSGLDGSILYTFDGDPVGDHFGESVSGAGDVNGDGFADLIVGAFADDNNGTQSGSARVFSGVDGSILYTFNGDSAHDQFGQSVSGAGDVDGDGFDDLIVGAKFDDNIDINTGSARVFSGVDGSILYTFDGGAGVGIFELFGNSVSGAGDVDGDGFADVIVGAPFDANNGSGSGSAWVFSGIDGSILFTFNGDSAHDLFGWSVSGAGDVNADGFADLIVGARDDSNNGEFSGSARVISPVSPPVFITQPISQIVNLGDPVSFTVAASGLGPISYQWREGGAKIFGATSPVLSIISTLESDEGNYDCVATNPFGSSTSASATLTVDTPVELVLDLVEDVMALEDVGESLHAMLSAALAVLDDLNDHNDEAAVHTLETFIDQVEAERGDMLTDEEADALIAAAQAIIDLILGA